MLLFRRVIAWILSAILGFSSLPVTEFDPGADIEAGKGFFESIFDSKKEDVSLWSILVEMNALLVRYIGSGDVSDEQISEAVDSMDSATAHSAVSDLSAIEAFADKLSLKELRSLSETNTARSIGFMNNALGLKSVFFSSLSSPDASNMILGGKIEVEDSAGTGAVSGNSVTVTAKGKLAASETNTVKIYNRTNAISTLTFDYSASNYKSFSLGNSSGTYTALLYPGSYVSFTIEAGAPYKTAKLQMSNFSLVAAAESSNVKFEYNSSYGTVTVDGTAVADGAVREITLADGATLVASAAGNGRFLGWINPSTGLILSTSASYKLTPVADTAVRAVFVGSTGVAYFRALGGNYLFDDLNRAMEYASASGCSTVVSVNDGTVPAGDYTIPSGVTLLIPFDDANTIYTTDPEIVSDAYTKPTAYRTLTMETGSNITVNGSLCLPAKHYSAHGSKVNGASPVGACPFIRMNSGSSVTVNSGGKLYAYGFITGSGTITAKKGADVYEYFQIMDFRGGSQTTDMDNGVFPLSQYYIQNIEVPLTIEAGARENCFASMTMSGMDFGTSVEFISSDAGMFNLSSGSVTKRYDEKTDRLVFEFDGVMSISPIEMEFGTSLLATKINSRDYELPINGNITVKANSGTITLAQDVAMLPGSEFIIGENAKCIIASGCNVYVYDSAEWGDFCGAKNQKFIPVQYAPGRKYNRTAADLKDAKIQIDGILDASNGFLYTTAGGADLCSSAKGKIILKKGSQSKTYQLVQNVGYTEIPITPAKLRNADGTYMLPSASTSTNYFVDGVWREHSGHSYTEKLVSEATCETAGIKSFTCFCGSTYTESSPAKGHTPGAAADCDSAQTCTVCGKELNAALGHNYSSVTVVPDCTKEGYTTHTCLRCGDSYIDGKTPAKGHTPGAAATCTSNQICTVCGVEVKPATGHDYQATVTAPTCTEKGYTTHSCLNCGDTYTDSETPAKGHAPGADATCTQPQICTVCGVTLKSENGHVPGAEATCTEPQSCTVCGETVAAALGHDMIHEGMKPASCTEDGYSSGSRCSRCGYAEGKTVIPAKGHTPGSAATCTSNQICTVCGVEVKPATGHNYQTTVTAPTCTEKGYTTHSCLNCGDTYTDSETPAKGHAPGAAATCSSAQKCEVCSEELAPALGHLPGAEATCTESQLCVDCGEILVPAKGHTPGAPASCVSAQTCTVCKQELVSATGHSYASEVIAPSCTENGYTVHTCSVCGDSYKDSEISALGHDMLPASCTKPSVCGNEGCGYTEGKPHGHTVVIDNEIPADCLRSGYTQGRHCSTCRMIIVEQKFVPAAGHVILTHKAKAPSFTSVGWEAYEECLNCDYTTYKEIPMLKEAVISDYETFVENLAVLEELAFAYVMEVPGKDPLALVLKYIRTGVEKYNEGSWGIMAGYEDAGFAEFVANIENEFNSMEENEEPILVSGLKNLECFVLPNGELVDFGHMFGSMDITYHNKGSLNHADVSGWAGDLVDLLEFSDYGGVTGTLDGMIADISANYLLQEDPEEIGGFNQQDMYGDLDSFYIMRALGAEDYEQGMLTEIMRAYYTEELTMEDRADYFLRNRLGGVSTRADVRDAVYNAYTGNKMLTTLEATKEFKTANVAQMRMACCYAFADYICKLAGDYVEVTENPYFTVFSSETSTLAPGIIQNIRKATSADNKQMVYYTATADLTREDVHVYANYKNNDPSVWGMQTVLGQANAAQQKYGNPESEHYIENYNVIASINGDGYNMGTGEPGGLLIMDGKEYHAIDGGGFFGITNEGKAVIGTQDEYNKIYKNQLKEAIGGFGTTLIKDGEIAITATSDYYTKRASRTSVGITKTGKVVFMVLDGRQEPVSCGGDMIEIAYIMYEAGCVHAINLDGGGSTTYVAKLEGADELSVVSRPSDGTARSVSTSLMMVSTAPSSTAFDHAVIDSETEHLTVGSSIRLTASGVSATGNAAELPEGTTWAVSDDSCCTLTPDGVLTALRNGSVDISLMLGDSVVGSTTINVVVPDRIYFSKENINAVYGLRAELPVVALYQNKPVTVNENDIVFALDKPEAGSFDGFGFTGSKESGVKNVVITASLAALPDRTASVSVSLYDEDEYTFDFDEAVGGDRTLAWNRVVSNSTTEDNILYEIVDREQPMVTEYTFAIDMTQIPIPEQLADLTTMLPGAEIEGASAWTFLMQLAERVSVLTQVRPSIKFDSNFDVDYSQITIINEYFILTDTVFDEETNTLTLILNWKDQTQPIDPAMANPLCILKGIKVTPKDSAEWSKNKLTPVNAGEVSYDMYMRANALYTFAQKPENQQAYGIYPFVNGEEKGGRFGSVYAEIEDTYTLSKEIKDGWVNEEGGFAYYSEGVKYTGIRKIDGYYYDFGENGINVGQTRYTGVFLDEEQNVYRYSKLGELASGWQMIGEDWYYFHPDTMAAKAGKYKTGSINVTYEFEETGKLVSGVWVKCVLGYRYYYGPSYHRKGFVEIDGNTYYFYNSYRYEGIRCVQESNSDYYTWYDFGDDGIRRDEVIPDGFYTEPDGSLYYVVDGIALEGLQKIDGDYYFFDYRCRAVKGTVYTDPSNCDLPVATYTFGDDYKMVKGLVKKEDGTIIYYENGRPKAKGLVEIDGDYYFAGGSNGEITLNETRYVWEGNGILPEGTYSFGPDGKMLRGIVETDGALYYYKDGKPNAAGLVEVDGAYYFACYSDGRVAVNEKRYVWEGNGLLPESNYEFGPDGKMLNGIVDIDGVLYYYENGKPKTKGLVEIDGAYYFACYSDGRIAVNENRYVWEGNGILPESNYEFGPDGRMLDGLVVKDGILYYYETGKPKTKGLVEIDGDYYFAGGSSGEVTVSQTRYVWEGNGILPEGDYEFGPDGRMLIGMVEKDGKLCFYETGRPKAKGFFELNGSYYCVVGSNGELAVNGVHDVTVTNGLLPAGKYEFDPDGKMLDGIVEKNGVLYYYENGSPEKAGLVEVDGARYFANGSNGEIAVDQKIYVDNGNGILPEDEYEFGPDGKMTDGFFERNGSRYYYVDGKPAPMGLVYVDGYYYFVRNQEGLLIVDQTYYIWETNGLALEMNHVFDEYGRIIG